MKFCDATYTLAYHVELGCADGKHEKKKAKKRTGKIKPYDDCKCEGRATLGWDLQWTHLPFQPATPASLKPPILNHSQPHLGKEKKKRGMLSVAINAGMQAEADNH